MLIFHVTITDSNTDENLMDVTFKRCILNAVGEYRFITGDDMNIADRDTQWIFSVKPPKNWQAETIRQIVEKIA